MSKYVETKDIFLTVNLPSNGVLPNYPKDWKISPLKVKDIKTIKSAPPEQELQIIVDVFQRLTSPEIKIEVKDLLLQDFDYLLYYVRINDIEDEIDLSFQCVCGKHYGYIGELSKLTETKLNKEYKEGVNEIEGIKYNLPRVRDLLYLIEKGVEKNGEISDENMLVMSLDVPLGDKVRVGENLKPKQAGKILSFLNKNNFGIKNSFDTKCTNEECGRAVSLTIPFRSKRIFIIPLFVE